MCCRNSLVFKCDCEHAEDSGDVGSVARSAMLPGAQRSHAISDSSKNIFQVDRIQSGAWREFPIGLGTLFRFASWVANERSDPGNRSRNIFQVGTVW